MVSIRMPTHSHSNQGKPRKYKPDTAILRTSPLELALCVGPGWLMICLAFATLTQPLQGKSTAASLPATLCHISVFSAGTFAAKHALTPLAKLVP